MTNCEHPTSRSIHYNPATDILTWECSDCTARWDATPTEDDREWESLITGGCGGCQ